MLFGYAKSLYYKSFNQYMDTFSRRHVVIFRVKYVVHVTTAALYRVKCNVEDRYITKMFMTMDKRNQ